MGYTINTKPTMNLNQGSAQASTQSNSTNVGYGIPDVPEEVKTKQMTRSDVQDALQKGEIVYGLIPEYPSLEAIDGVLFDYCDGLRIYVPPVKDGPKKKYFVQIQEERMGVILHNQAVESGAYISTLQKFYTEFSLAVVKEEYLPDDVKERLRTKHNVDDDVINVVTELSWVPTTTIDVISQELDKRQVVIQYKEDFIESILSYVKDNYSFIHKFNPEGKEIMVQLPAGTIGDSIGWFAYMERFQQKTKCKLICVMNPFISVLFEKQYPDITFIPPKETIKYKPYASYKMGLFFKGNTTGVQEVFLGHVFVDRVAQALRTSLRRKSQTALSHLLQTAHDFHGEIVSTKARK